MSKQPLHLRAPAKLNLFLHLVGRRRDGYHLLQTVFQLIDLCDQLTLAPAPRGVCAWLPGSDMPGGDEDLVLRAARALRRAGGSRGGVRVGLCKRIPVGGGLGGGSSDAAAVLLGLNRLWGLGMPRRELAQIGASLGADVPLFVHGHTAWGEGTGDRLTPIQTPAGVRYLILAPPVPVPTAQVFADCALTHSTPIRRIPPRYQIDDHSGNDCTSVVRRLHPAVGRALDWCAAYGVARLSGTGGCVFLVCDDLRQARAIRARVPEEFATFLARPLKHSPLTRLPALVSQRGQVSRRIFTGV